MFSTKLIIGMSIIFLLEILVMYLKNRKYNQPPNDDEYDKYNNLTKTLTNNTFTLATLTVAILVLFLLQGSHVGTQTLLIYGFSLLFLSAFMNEFSGLKKIVYFIQRRTLNYWFYSIIASILTLYISPPAFYTAGFKGIIVVLFVVSILVFFLHIYSFYLELKVSKT